MSKKPIVVGGQAVEPGTRAVVRLPVTKDLNGAEIRIAANVLCGREEGPTLLLLSELHGNEWLSVEVIRRVLEKVNPKSLKGNLLAVPVANPVAFNTNTRCVLDDSDGPDLNRSFGGEFTWLTDQMAQVLSCNLFNISQYMIDYHPSDWGSYMGQVSYGKDFSNPEVAKKSEAMAKAFAYPCLQAGNMVTRFPGPRSSIGFAGEKYGIAGIAAEIGGLGFEKDVEEKWYAYNVDGTLNVMKHLGMVDGLPRRPDRYLVWTNRWRANPTVAGYLEPARDYSGGFLEVEKGELLARVISPYTYEVLEELRSPGHGIVYYGCRNFMVRPGYFCFGVVDLEDGQSGWVDAG